MPKINCLLILCSFFLSFIQLNAQDFKYSPPLLLARDESDLLIAGKAGNSIHAWQLHATKKPVLWRFDTAMQVLSAEQLNIPLRNSYQVSLLSFPDHYLLFALPRKKQQSSYLVYRVTASGVIENQTALLQSLVNEDSSMALNGFSITLVNNRLFFLSAMALPGVKKGKLTIQQTDSLLSKPITTHLLFDFEAEQDVIQQLLITNDSTLFIVKTGKRSAWDNRVTIYRFNSKTGASVSVSYNSDRYLFEEPFLYANASGQHISLLAAIIPVTKDAPRQTTIVKKYIVHLSDSLTELMPGSIVDINTSTPSLVSKSAEGKFGIYKTQHLHDNGFVLFSTYLTRGSLLYESKDVYRESWFSKSLNQREKGETMFDSSFRYSNYSNTYNYYSPREDNTYPFVNSRTHFIRLTWLNSSDHIQQDTILANNEKRLQVDFSGGLIHYNNNQLAVLYPATIKRNRNTIIRYVFSTKGEMKELLLNTNFSNTHFLYRAVQLDEHSYISPYRQRDKTGLVKITF